VLWGRYQGMTDIVASHRSHRHAVLADMTLPGSAEQSITARSPLRWNGEYGEAGAAPALGRESEQVLAEWLGLSSAEIGGLRERGVIGTAERR
jgi:2-methylfumaryl-CoA isomerase